MIQVSSNSIIAFWALVKAGLWEEKIQFSSFESFDFSEIYRLAEEQTVVGLVTAGFEHVQDAKVPQQVVLTFVGNALQIEQRNLAMNVFVAKLISQLRNEDIYTLLVKGQGIAQCYERPLWRVAGDVDLFLSEENYQKAKIFLKQLASSSDNEDSYYQHISMIIDSWEVELHGSLRSGLWKKLDKGIDDTQKTVFYEGQVRSWMCGETQVFLPRADEDVIFVFSHILQHFFREGVGLRQVCDWCRLLWRYKETINKSLLEGRLKELQIFSEWRAFASLAVNKLGMPKDAMPFYSDAEKWQDKADRILSLIIENGSFGHNRDKSYYSNHSYLIRKIISLWRHTVDGLRFFTVFPLDSIKVWTSTMLTGVRALITRS